MTSKPALKAAPKKDKPEAEVEAEALSSEQDVVAPSSDDCSILGSGYVFYCFI
jgi:hypothetical protein